MKEKEERKGRGKMTGWTNRKNGKAIRRKGGKEINI
jgi:hypothetical protein